MIKVAVVGIGFMGKMHLSTYGQFKDVEIAAICDVREENFDIASSSGGGNIAVGEMNTDLKNVKTYTDYSNMIGDGGFDFIDLCIPTHLHSAYTIQALQAGYDVFCEKPMALKVEEADDMIRAAEKAGKLLTVGQCLRFWPMYVKIKEIIDSGEYGPVLSSELARYANTPLWTSDNWILNGELSGNAALDLHIHDVDMVLNLFGNPEAVCSSGVESPGSGYGHISTIYDYPDKTVTSVGNWICSDSFGFIMRALVVLEQAVIVLDSSKTPALTIFPQGKEALVPELDPKDGYYHELRSFVDNIKTRTRPEIVTPETARDALAITLAEIKSAKTREKVRM